LCGTTPVCGDADVVEGPTNLTISCIRCTIFCSRSTKRINVTQAQIEDGYNKPTQAQLQTKLNETSTNTSSTTHKEEMAVGTERGNLFVKRTDFWVHGEGENHTSGP
jgi:hypothetical protein